jgi:type IV pilus assembly protein PilF
MRQIFTITFLLLLSLFLFSCSLKDQAKIDTHFQLGIASLQEGDMTEALRQLLQAEQLEQEDPEIHNALGLAYLGKEKYEKAIEHFTSAVELKPDYPEAHNNMGVSYLRLYRWEKAIVSCRRAADNLLYRTPERAYLNIGWAYYNLGDFQQALIFYNKALEKLPNWCMARYNLALAQMKLSQYSDALYNLTLAVDKCPVYRDAYEAIGDAYKVLGQFGKAKESYLKCNSLGPETTVGRSCQQKANLIR